jgi:4-diphosphocytidyl-2-C-methyl-D-erythritol kinase
MTTLWSLSPAKINLGLEIIRRRDDGYHDLMSIFQTVTLYDRLELIHPAAAQRLEVLVRDERMHELETSNLVSSAMEQIGEVSGSMVPVQMRLTKQIPIASGLGGSSSNAATALRMGQRLFRSRADSTTSILEIARSLGSDVPYFLNGGTALVTGRGDAIEPLSQLTNAWFVLMSPRLADPIPSKTATLYRSLVPSDFTSGDRIREQAFRLQRSLPLDDALLRNAFQRPLLHLRPELDDFISTFFSAGAPFVALSGAGPSHYTIVRTKEEAERIATRTRSILQGNADILVATTVPDLPPIHESSTNIATPELRGPSDPLEKARHTP